MLNETNEVRRENDRQLARRVTRLEVGAVVAGGIALPASLALHQSNHSDAGLAAGFLLAVFVLCLGVAIVIGCIRRLHLRYTSIRPEDERLF